MFSVSPPVDKEKLEILSNSVILNILGYTTKNEFM
jgi:hypothetical protein